MHIAAVAHGRGAAAFSAVMDNTDVFFKLARIVGARWRRPAQRAHPFPRLG